MLKRWSSNSISMTECTLKVGSGYLRGLVKKTVLNFKKYYSFQGIPYARPPIGINRFKDPVPYPPWEGEHDATKHGNVCPQVDEFQKRIVGSEDCLFLNIYTPQIPDETTTDSLPLPVMVYLHGGGFTFGSGNDKIYGPDYLIEHDVILITINYRVGVFGFLSLGNSDVPGNAGLKDQNLALKWIHNHVKYFGGDPDNVTLFGESAGAASVHYHTLSPMSNGLFNRVILQSGCALNPWAFYENPVHRAFTLGELLGKTTTDSNELIAFLREQPAEILVKHQLKVLSSDERKKLSFSFVPCKEVIGTGSNFLTECPETLLKSKKFSEIPYLIGMTDKEGMIMLKEDSNLLEKLEKVNNDPQRLVPYEFCSNEACYDIAQNVKKFYSSGIPLTPDTIANYIDISTDLEFLIGIEKTLGYLSLKPALPIHVYLFTFEGQLGYLKAFINAAVKNLPKGVCHADELGYIFHNNFMSKEFPVDKESKEKSIIDKLSTFWTNFAKNSNPNDEKYGIKWGCYEAGYPQYLEINDSLRVVKTDLFPERIQFWRDVYSSVKLINKL